MRENGKNLAENVASHEIKADRESLLEHTGHYGLCGQNLLKVIMGHHRAFLKTLNYFNWLFDAWAYVFSFFGAPLQFVIICAECEKLMQFWWPN